MTHEAPEEKGMKILGIDPGSDCGFAVIGPAGICLSGVWDLRPKRGESPGARYLRLLKYLREARAAYPDIELVAYEQAHQRGGAATEYAIGCVTLIQAWCAENGIEHASLHSAAVKRYAVGKGSAKKEEMLEAARMQYNRPIHDDNEADALFIAALAWQEYGKE